MLFSFWISVRARQRRAGPPVLLRRAKRRAGIFSPQAQLTRAYAGIYAYVVLHGSYIVIRSVFCEQSFRFEGNFCDYFYYPEAGGFAMR